MTAEAVAPDDLRVEVGGGRRVAVHLHRPAPGTEVDRPVVAFAFPGGGYSRGYYDIRHEGGSYSQAAFHTARGWIVAACDHLGVGDSDHPDPAALTVEALAEANHAAVRGVLAQLDVEPALVLGIGQSMGGCLTIVAQGRHRTFDAVAVLGFSARHTVLPSPRGGLAVTEVARGSTEAAAIEAATAEIGGLDSFRWAFHSDDADPELVEADLAGGYPLRSTAPSWGSTTVPPAAVSMLSAGVVADEAAAIEVPVFIGCGARDVVPDPRAEPGAYVASDDLTVFVVRDMAHMHNFARTRAVLWDRLHHWAEGVRDSQI